jgi:diguanylate cyclase (GGDEF)-like protein/PAS domain S-box-containing protein
LAFLDVKTVFFVYVATSALSVIVMSSLWFQNRKRSPETALWLADFVMQFLGLLLLTLRGVVPDILSMVVANMLIIAGTVCLLIGLEIYLDLRGRQWQNYVGLGVFTVIQSYFTFVRPDMAARSVNISVALALICAQVAWLLLYRTNCDLRSATRAAGTVFVCFVAAAVVRALLTVREPFTTSLFQAGTADTLVYLAYLLLFAALTFTLVLMVSRRLLNALERDIEQRERSEYDLRKSESKFSAAFHTVPDAMLITRLADGTIIDANDGFLRITGYTRVEAIGKTTLELGTWADIEDREWFVDQLSTVGQVCDFAAEYNTKSGQSFPALISASLMDVDGEQLGLTLFRDITATKLAEEQLRALSDRDPLTGILNYRAFYSLAADRLARITEAHAALIFLDLDGLKNINDLYGHPVGDQALVTLADVLHDAFRESDTVGRLGGDEFAVLVISREEVSDEIIMSRFLGALDSANETCGLPFLISASAGIAWRGEAGTTLQELISIADGRMYEAKRALKA